MRAKQEAEPLNKKVAVILKVRLCVCLGGGCCLGIKDVVMTIGIH